MNTTFTLHIVGPQGELTIPLGPNLMWAGRSADAEIQLDDPAISRRQFSLEPLITSSGSAMRIRLNPESQNYLIKDGLAYRELTLQADQGFSLGSYRFHLHAREQTSLSENRALPPDPAGQIEVALAQEQRRIAPRWQQLGDTATGEASQGTPDKGGAPRALLGVAVILIGLAAAWYFDLFPSDDQAPASGPVSSTIPDLFAAMPRLECEGKQACLSRAVEAIQHATRLQQGGSRDLLTVYRIARHLHRATITLGPDAASITELGGKYDTAKVELEATFGDLWFRLKRSVENENQRDQVAMLRALYPLCEEDPHQFCSRLDLFYKRVRD